MWVAGEIRKWIADFSCSVLRLGRDRRGNVALFSALAMLPVMLAMGMGIDYAMCESRLDQLRGIADAAALKAVAPAMLTQSDSSSQAAAENYFNALAGAIPDVSVTNAHAVVTDNAAGTGRSVTLNYAAASNTLFSGLLGTTALSMSGASTASGSKAINYFQVIFLVDISGSMSTGATSQINTLMNNDASMGHCAFACHNPNGYDGPTDWRAVARQKGYTLKIDSEVSAMGSFITALQTFQSKYPTANFSTGIYSFGNFLYTNQAPTTDLAAAANAAAAVDAEPIQAYTPATNWNYTYTTNNMQTVINNIKNVGDGTSATSRITYFILITDGVEDVPGAHPDGRQSDTNYTYLCGPLIKKYSPNLSIFTIWTDYPPVTSDSQYSYMVQPIYNQIPTALQSCANPPGVTTNGQYLKASDGPAIEAAVNTVLQKILALSTAKLTQ